MLRNVYLTIIALIVGLHSIDALRRGEVISGSSGGALLTPNPAQPPPPSYVNSLGTKKKDVQAAVLDGIKAASATVLPDAQRKALVYVCDLLTSEGTKVKYHAALAEIDTVMGTDLAISYESDSMSPVADENQIYDPEFEATAAVTALKQNPSWKTLFDTVKTWSESMAKAAVKAMIVGGLSTVMALFMPASFATVPVLFGYYVLHKHFGIDGDAYIKAFVDFLFAKLGKVVASKIKPSEWLTLQAKVRAYCRDVVELASDYKAITSAQETAFEAKCLEPFQ